MHPIGKGRAFVFAHLLPMVCLAIALVGEVYISWISHTAKTFGPFTVTMWSPAIWIVTGVMNAWAPFPAWRSATAAFLAGAILPGIVAVVCGVVLLEK